MTNPDPGEQLAEILLAHLDPAPAAPVPDGTPAVGPRVPEPNPAQGSSGTANPIPDPLAAVRAFVESLALYAAQGPTGGWQDLYSQSRGRGF